MNWPPFAWTNAQPKRAVRRTADVQLAGGAGGEAGADGAGHAVSSVRVGATALGVGRSLNRESGVVDSREHVAGEGRGHGEIPVGGVGDGEAPGVQEVAGAGAAPVQLVAGDRRADGGQVDAESGGCGR